MVLVSHLLWSRAVDDEDFELLALDADASPTPFLGTDFQLNLAGMVHKHSVAQ